MALSGEKLSGSTDGRAIKITQTATAGDLIHTATSTGKDYITLYAFNAHTAPVDLTLEWGGVSDPDDRVIKTLPIGEERLVVAKRILQNGLLVRAFASAANVVMLHGSVDRVT